MRQLGPGAAALTEVIAIDGPAGSGKSTVARAVAERLGWAYLDTGSLYRALTWWALERGVPVGDGASLAAAVVELEWRVPLAADRSDAPLGLDGRVPGELLRADAVTGAVSEVSAHPAVRAAMLDLQRRLLVQRPTVAEGRDVGSVVVPAARLAVYLDADPEVRAARRRAERPGAGAAVANLARRDAADSTRAAAPLRRTARAVPIDTTTRTAEQVIQRVIDLAIERFPDLSTRHLSAMADHEHEPPADEGWTPERDAVPSAGAEPVAATSAGSPPTIPPRVRGVRDDRALRRYDLGLFSPRFVRRWSRAARLLVRLLFRVEVAGEHHVPSSGAVLIIGNHSGFLDGPLVVMHQSRPVRILAKVELFAHPRVRRFLLTAGEIPVHRGRPDRAALRACVAVIASGGVLGVFPEGTRGAGTVSAIQHGAAYVLARAGVSAVQVVPVVCRGTAEALPKGGRPRLRSRILVDFGAPFSVELPTDRHARAALDPLAEQLRRGLVQHLAQVPGVGAR